MEGNVKEIYDAIIIGAGPGGLFSAISLAKRGFKVLLLDKGGDFNENLCNHFVKQTYNVSLKEPCCCQQLCLSGFGGAALHFEANFDNYPYEDMNAKGNFVFSSSLFSALRDETKKYITQFYDYMFKSGLNNSATQSIIADIESVKIHSSGTIPVNLSEMKNIAKHLEEDILLYGVQYLKRKLVTSINKDSIFTVTCIDSTSNIQEFFLGKTVVVATGSRSFPFVLDLIKKHNLCHHFPKEVELGFRVETSSTIMEKLLGNNYNPRIKSVCGKHRTFCICLGGRIMKYPFVWGHKSFILDGQHAYSQKGNKTNFSLLSKVSVPSDKNSYEYVCEFVKNANDLTPGSIPVQRLSDYLKEKKSSQRDIDDLSLTMRGCSSADLSCLARKYSIQIDWFISFVEAVLSKTHDFCGTTVLLAPSIAKYAPIISLNGTESSLNGLFFVGDVSGVVSGISAAGAMGLKTADQIINNRLD